MSNGLVVVGPIDVPYVGQYKGSLYGARFVRFEFCTDLTRRGAPIFPCGILMELCIDDGTILAGIARTQITSAEIKLVNLATWGDSFAGSSVAPFFEKCLESATKPLGNPLYGYLKNISMRHGSRGALRTVLPFEEVPLRIMIACNLRMPHELTRADGLARLAPLLEYVADDPFLTEYH